jgi:hypothetical protein
MGFMLTKKKLKASIELINLLYIDEIYRKVFLLNPQESFFIDEIRWKILGNICGFS